jgi:hypothetical protein
LYSHGVAEIGPKILVQNVALEEKLLQ